MVPGSTDTGASNVGEASDFDEASNVDDAGNTDASNVDDAGNTDDAGVDNNVEEAGNEVGSPLTLELMSHRKYCVCSSPGKNLELPLPLVTSYAIDALEKAIYLQCHCQRPDPIQRIRRVSRVPVDDSFDIINSET